MMRLTKWILGAGVLAVMAGEAGAFSLLGPLKNAGNDPWQNTGFGGRPQGLGYSLAGDIGGPMTPLEGYRWTYPVITYAFDSTFLRYFGTNGVAAVESAFQMLNELPPASQMSSTLTEFPLDTKAVNSTAATLGLLDVKSITMSLVLEEFGLANPERFVCGLRDRFTAGGNPGVTNYSVIQMNYDPVTLQESRYVNGVLYNYRIFDDLGPMGAEWASAVEWYQLDPLFQPYSSVAGGIGSSDAQLGSSPDDIAGLVISGLSIGEFYRGFTRDDVGGLRFLLSTNNIVVESLLPDVFPSRSGGVGGSPWAPFPVLTNAPGTTNAPGGTNATGTNLSTLVRTAMRAGKDKITFQRVDYDSLLSSTFRPITNRYTDTFINSTNGKIVKQKVERIIFQPDMLFAVGDLGTVTAIPVLTGRSGTTGWSNNVALNTATGGLNLGGPGVITPGILFSFTDLVPYYFNDLPADQDVTGFIGAVWGSFDGSDQPPVVYPIFQHPLLPNLSLQYLQSVALGKKKK